MFHILRIVMSGAPGHDPEMVYWKIHDKQIVLGVSPMLFRIFAGYINSHSNQISCWLNPSSPKWVPQPLQWGRGWERW